MCCLRITVSVGALCLGLSCNALAQSGSAGSASQSCVNDVSKFNFTAAVGDCTNAILQNPKDEDALRNRCKTYNGLGNYPLAITDCTAAIALNPQDEDAYNTRCGVYYDQSNYSAAVADCTRAIALKPADYTSYVGRCEAYDQQGNYSAAIADCTQALSLSPNYELAYSVRGGVYQKQGQNAQALADLQKALSLDPSDDYAKNALAKLTQTGPSSPAASTTAANPVSPRLSNIPASPACGNDIINSNYTAALSDCSQNIEMNPNDAESFDDRGFAYFEIGDNAAALSDLNRAIALAPNTADAYDWRGSVYAKLGQRDQAIADFRKALALNPTDQIAVSGLGNFGVAADSSTSSYFTVQCVYTDTIWGKSTQTSTYPGRIINITVDLDKKKYYETSGSNVGMDNSDAIRNLNSVSDGFITLISQKMQPPNAPDWQESINRVTGAYDREILFPDGSGGETDQGPCAKAILIPFPPDKF